MLNAWAAAPCSCADAVWEFRVLLVRESMTSGLLELYSTPPGAPVPNIAAPAWRQTLALLSQKYTGEQLQQILFAKWWVGAYSCDSWPLQFLQKTGLWPETLLIWRVTGKYNLYFLGWARHKNVCLATHPEFNSAALISAFGKYSDPLTFSLFCSATALF